MQISVVFGILFIAHGRFTYLLQGFLQLQLLVDHFASSCAVYTLACVHIECLQILGEACPSVAAGHGLLSIQVGAHLQRSGDVVGDGLACLSIMVHS